MSRNKLHGDKEAGAAPGTVVYVGSKRESTPRITLLKYSQGHVEEKLLTGPEACPHTPADGVEWYTIDGIHDVSILKRLGEIFNLHPLVLEDIANTTQRPKLEDFGNYLFVTFKMIVYDRDNERIQPEHVSLIVFKGMVLAFLEDEGDVFEPVRQRIRTGHGRIRTLGSDYLMYALADAVVDHYFEVLEQLGDRLEELENELVDAPTRATLHSLHSFKRELIYLRRASWPLREAVNQALRTEGGLISDGVKVFLRDLYDHTVQVIDSVETLRDIVTGMLDVYLSSISNKMNEVMKVLTIMSTIFIPLTFIAGVYGMNFKYMPELDSPYGYPAVMLIMLVVAIALVFAFRKRGWI